MFSDYWLSRRRVKVRRGWGKTAQCTTVQNSQLVLWYCKYQHSVPIICSLITSNNHTSISLKGSSGRSSIIISSSTVLIAWCLPWMNLLAIVLNYSHRYCKILVSTWVLFIADKQGFFCSPKSVMLAILFVNADFLLLMTIFFVVKCAENIFP